MFAILPLVTPKSLISRTDAEAVITLGRRLQLKIALRTCRGTLQFAPDAATVTPTTLDLSTSCLSRVPHGYGQYYYGINSSGLTCVSNCSGRNPYYYECYNGECLITKPGPECFCQYSDYYWYSGKRCQQVISKIGVYVGVSLALALLLILFAVLAFLVYRYKYRFATLRINDVEKKWYEEGWESNAPEGFTVRSPQTVSWAVENWTTTGDNDMSLRKQKKISRS
ncbi:hypothetical protein NDU88_004546 [Pleurodeles waltl]|uniref:Uncharacterized protein n=1 Tax=Pleurodeles waltl TaxID=8319 RepID=A0AAV7L077_PLEWA|nr:hypothetical protein NDU88_004546 [Pleurodeles waltl]